MVVIATLIMDYQVVIDQSGQWWYTHATDHTFKIPVPANERGMYGR